jgi:hypothetical protein
MAAPSLSQGHGLSSHFSSTAGILDGPSCSGHPACSAVRLKSPNLALDSWSANVAPVPVHLVILITSGRQPMPAATVAIALTKVVQSRQFHGTSVVHSYLQGLPPAHLVAGGHHH